MELKRILSSLIASVAMLGGFFYLVTIVKPKMKQSNILGRSWIDWVLPFALGIIGAAVGMFILWLLLP